MNVSKPKNFNIEFLTCIVDSKGTDDSDYLFLVDGKFFRYVVAAGGALAGEERERCCGLTLLRDLLPPFPPGDWNKGYVDQDPETGEVAFITTETEDFPAVKNLWHPVRVHELDFSQSKQNIKQRVHVATNPGFNGGQPVVLKFSVWLDEIGDIENETTIYEYIYEKGIGPKFLGHLTEGPENGRVIGMVIEWVPDARPAQLGDLEGCKMALGRLHELGIKLGDTNRFNFLVREGHEVVLIDFEMAKQCSPEELEAEMNGLEEKLASKISIRDVYYVIVAKILQC